MVRIPEPVTEQPGVDGELTETAKSEHACSESNPVLEWHVCLAKEYPGRLAVALAVVITCVLVSIVMFGSVIFSLVTLFLLFSALAEFICPVRYAIDKDGATVSSIFGTTRVEWSRVKKCYLDDFGIKLSTIGRRSRLEAYRGAYIRFGDRRDEVIRVVKMVWDGYRSRTQQRGTGKAD